MSSRRTRTLGLPLLKENDAANFAVFNETITRMDVLANLYLESTVVEQEPRYGAGELYEGQAWAISPGNLTGPHWGGVTEDSIAFFGRLPSEDINVISNTSRNDLGWYIVPAWEGAYAYDKADGVFKTYTGSGWTQPSKRKITNFVMGPEDIERCTQLGNENWYTALSVEGAHELLEVHAYVTYSDAIISASLQSDEFYGMLGGQELTGGQPALPYIIPKISLATSRPSAAYDPSPGIVAEGKQALGQSDSGKWSIPGGRADTTDIPLANLTADPDSYGMGVAMRGIVTRFDDPPSFNLNANNEGFLLVNLTDWTRGDAGIFAIEDLIHSMVFQVTYSGF